MQKVWITFVAIFLGASSVAAQVPVERLPQGSGLAGWAVEAIPVPEMQGRLERQRSQTSVAVYAGQTGIARKSVEPGFFASAQFDAFGGDRQKLVYNGRAFLRVQAAQQYVLVATPVASSRHRQEGCELIINVGGKPVVGGTFRPLPSRLTTVRVGRATGPELLSGNVNLQPGFYPIEFIVGCLRSFEPIPLEIQFQVREERDAAPRNFAAGELFHVQR